MSRSESLTRPFRGALGCRADPEVVIDLHSSGGIYGEPGNGVGQAISPTPDGSAIASRVCDRLNSVYIDAVVRPRRSATGAGFPLEERDEAC